jgi:hypothetical protein
MVDCVVSAGLLLYLILGAIVGMVISLRKIFKLEQTILSIDQKLVGNLGLRPVKLVTSKKPVKKKVTKRKSKKRR